MLYELHNGPVESSQCITSDVLVDHSKSRLFIFHSQLAQIVLTARVEPFPSAPWNMEKDSSALDINLLRVANLPSRLLVSVGKWLLCLVIGSAYGFYFTGVPFFLARVCHECAL